MKVLHTIDPDGRGCSTYSAALLADLIGATPELEHEVLVVGSADDAAFVRSLGPDAVTRVPRRPRWLNWPSARGRHGRSADGVFDVVHAWGTSSVSQAGGASFVTTMHAPDGDAPPPDLVVGDAVLLAPRDPIAAAWRDAGVSDGRCRTIAPGVDAARVQRDQRDAVRGAWSVGDDEMVVGVLGDPPAGTDVWNAVTLQSLLTCAKRQVRVAVLDGGRHHVQAGRWARSLELEDRIIRDTRLDQPWRIAAALDAAFVVNTHSGSRGAGMLPVLWAMAAGLAVLAERGGGAETIIETGRNGLLVDSGRTDRICHNLVRLHDDPAMRRVLGEAARQTADRDHRADTFGRRVLDVYAGLGVASVEPMTARSERAGPAPHRDTATGASVPADACR